MEENTQLPKEVVDKIEQEAHDAASSLYSPAKYNEFTSYQSGYIKGATVYTTQLHQANEKTKVLTYDNNKLKGQVEGLTSAVEELKRWKSGAIILLSKIDQYADKHPEIKLGMGKVEFTIERAKKFDAAKSQQGARWIKAKVFSYEEHIEYYYKYEYLGKTIKGVGMYDKHGFFRVLPSRGLPPVGLDKVYILDEAPDTLNPELLQVMQDAEKSKEEDLKAVKEVIAAGRDEAVELLRWLNENDWSGVGSGEYINHTNGRIISEAKLYQEFKKREK